MDTSKMPYESALHCKDCGHMLIPSMIGNNIWAHNTMIDNNIAVCTECGAVYRIDETGIKDKLMRIIYTPTEPGTFIYTCQRCGWTDYYPVYEELGNLHRCHHCNKEIPLNMHLYAQSSYNTLAALDKRWNVYIDTSGTYGKLDNSVTAKEAKKEEYTLTIDLDKLANNMKDAFKEAGKIVGKVLSKAKMGLQEMTRVLPLKDEARVEEKAGEDKVKDKSDPNDRILVIAPDFNYWIETNKSKIEESKKEVTSMLRSYYYEQVEGDMEDLFNAEGRYDRLEIMWYGGYKFSLKDTDALKRFFDTYRERLDEAGQLAFYRIRPEEIMNFAPFFDLVQLAQSEWKPVYIL